MQCYEVEKWIEQFADDELGFLFKKDVEAHISSCRTCERILTNIQTVRGLMKNSLPVLAPSGQMDARVFEAFNRRHEQNRPKLTAVRSAIIGDKISEKVSNKNSDKIKRFLIPSPAFALASLIFIAALAMAFQAGRITATDVNLTVSTPESQIFPSKKSALPVSHPAKESEIKNETSENALVREKVVTRIIYVETPENATGKEIRQNAGNRGNKANKTKNRRTKIDSGDFALNNAVAENGYLTQANLKGFKPASEIKPTIIKGDEIDAK